MFSVFVFVSDIIKGFDLFTTTLVFATGTEMAQLICGGCHTLLMFIRGATSVQCSCCHTVNLALEGDKIIQNSAVESLYSPKKDEKKKLELIIMKIYPFYV